MTTIEGESQQLAELRAALDLGNERLESTFVREVARQIENILNLDTTHYLFLREPDDLASFFGFGCGTALGAANAMVEDGSICRLYSIPKNECPNCNDSDDASWPMGAYDIEDDN